MKKTIILIVTIMLMLPQQQAEASRLWSSGFELQSVDVAMEFDTVTGSPTIDTSLVRSGLASLKVAPTGATAYIQHVFADSSTNEAIYIRFYMYVTSCVDATDTIARFLDNNSVANTVSMRMRADCSLDLRNDSDAAQLGSVSSILNTGQWYRIEMMINEGANTISARIDGSDFVTNASLGTFANRPTRIQLGAVTATTANLNFDDLAINTSVGTYQTSWPGEGNIVHMQPNAAGDSDGSLSAPNGWQQVDEVTPDDGTTIAVLDANNDILSVNLESAESAGIDPWDSVTLVQGNIREAAASAASANWQLGIKSQSGGTILSGTLNTHNDTTYRTNGDGTPRVPTVTAYVDPQAGGAWTTTLLDTTQILASTTDATPDVNISTLWALVEYIDGVAPPPPLTNLQYGQFLLGSGQLIFN